MRLHCLVAGLGCVLIVWPTLAVATEDATAEAIPARPLDPIAAEYPTGVVRDHPVEVILRVEVDDEGRLVRAEALTEEDSAFSRAALEAIAGTRFEPSRLNGEEVASILDVRFEFLPPATDEPVTVDEEAEMTAVVRAARPRTASETVVDVEILRAAPRLSATDVLRSVPGLVASRHGGEGKADQIFLRGFDAQHGQDVEITVEGLPVNEVSHIHALGYANLSFLIPEAVREIAVQEGPYRADQGDFAVAGSLRIGLGLPEKGLLFAPNVGSFGQRRMVVGVRPGDDASTFAAAEISGGDGFGPARHFGKASALAQGSLELGSGSRVRTLLGSFVARHDTPGVLREDDFQAGRVDFFDTYTHRQGGSTSRHQALVELELPRGEDGSRTTLTAFGIRSTLRLRNNFTGFRFDDRGDGQEQTHDGTTLGVRADHRRLLSVFSKDVQIHGGIGARHDRLEQRQMRYREVDGTFYSREIDGRIAQTNLWSFAEAATRLGGWHLRLGSRADALAADVFDAIAFENPRFDDVGGYTRSAYGVHLGLKGMVARDLGRRTRLALEYGDGFRSPQARSLSEGQRTPFVRVRAGEVGLRHVTDRVDFSTAAFGSYVADDFYFDHTVGTTVQVGETLRSGVTATARLRPIEGLHAALSATAAHAVIVSSRALLPYFAPLVGRADAGYRRAFTLLGRELEGFAGTGLTLIGPRPLPYDEFSRTVFLADARFSVRRGPVALRIDVTNVLDARWRDGEFVYGSRFDTSREGSSLPSRHFTAGPPRTVWAALELLL